MAALRRLANVISEGRSSNKKAGPSKVTGASYLVAGARLWKSWIYAQNRFRWLPKAALAMSVHLAGLMVWKRTANATTRLLYVTGSSWYQMYVTVEHGLTPGILSFFLRLHTGDITCAAPLAVDLLVQLDPCPH